VRVWLSDRPDEGGLLMCVELEGQMVAYIEWNGNFTVFDFEDGGGWHVPIVQPGGWRLAEWDGS